MNRGKIMVTITTSRNPNLTIEKWDERAHEIRNILIKKNITWWSGIAPDKCPGYDVNRKCLTALPLLNLDICTRQDVWNYFNNSWTLTELLFSALKEESAFIRPPYHGLRHPLIFYYGHPAVFYTNKLRLAGLISEPIDSYLERVLEIGVDEMSWDDMGKNEMAWPSVEEVRAYRLKVYNIISKLILEHPDLDLVGKNKLETPWCALWMGMEHEKIHFETSSVLIRELPINLVETPEHWTPIHFDYKDDLKKTANRFISHKGGEILIGKDRNAASFGWDNEYGKRQVLIDDFVATEYQITNGEYLEFVKSLDYVKDEFWSEEGREWRKFRNTRRPTFWAASGPEGSHQYMLRTIFKMIPLPLSWPAEVNFHEAYAYCQWKCNRDTAENKNPFKLKYRLLTEAEFVSLIPQDKLKSDPVLQKKSNVGFEENFNFTWSSPRNVDNFLLGNTWHWLMDQFNPLEGFEINPLYDDFSMPCFDGKHQMMRGGSFISCGDEASVWSRFHFRPHFYQCTGFRMAATSNGSATNGEKLLVVKGSYVHPRRFNVLDQIESKNQESNPWWMNIDQPLELLPQEMITILDQTKNEIIKFHEKFHHLSPMGEAHDPISHGLKINFRLPYQTTKNFPTTPEKFEELLKTIFNDLQRFSQIPGHPGFAAYVAGAGNFISSVAEMISKTINPFTGHYMMAPGMVGLEREVISWFLNMVGFDPRTSDGFLTTGGSYATLSAISMARNNKLASADGNISDAVAYTSIDSHHSVAKSWAILGFKKENLRYVPVRNFKMDADALEDLIEHDMKLGLKPFLVVPSLGTTKTGAIDPLLEVIVLAKKFNLWIHGDGAYGAFFMLTKTGQERLGPIAEVDSLTLDPHKALMIPYGTGCLLVKNKNNMLYDYHAENSYMPPGPDELLDYADMTPELSRDFRGLKIWLPIKFLGIGPFVLNLEEKLRLTEWVCAEIKKINHLKLVSIPDLTIITFKHIKSNEDTEKLLVSINKKETLFLSSCLVEGELCIRICLLGFRLHFDRLEKFINELKEMVKNEE